MISSNDIFSVATSLANTKINALSSDLIQEIDGVLSVVDGYADKIENLKSDVRDFLDTVDGVIDGLTALDFDILSGESSALATIFDPTAIPNAEPKEDDPTFDRLPDTREYDINPPVPLDIYVDPIGSEPPLNYKGQYPYVHTYKSESGHIREVDDTPGNERLLDFHRSGTYQDIGANGRRVVKVVNDNFTIVAQNDIIHVEGSVDLYIKGNIRIICLNDAQIDVAGRVEVNSGEDIRIKGKIVNIEE